MQQQLSEIDKNFFFNQKVKFRHGYSDFNLYRFFYEKTRIFPENIIYRAPFIFFFVNNQNYYKARKSLKSLRISMEHKKILIVRSEITLVNLIFSFFPDIYIHDILLNIKSEEQYEVKIICYFYEDRGIAIGKNGVYIKVLNEIFNEHIRLEKINLPIRIMCDFYGS